MASDLDAAGKEQKCEKCHAKGKGEGKKVELKEAFHKNCKDCHKAGKKGPETRILAMSFCEPRSWTRVLSS